MISYFGGKASMVEFINKFIPRNIKNYVEPFSGAFWTYMNTKYQFPELDKIVYNDFNGHMANLFACLKEHDKFLKLLEKELQPKGFLYTTETEKTKIRDFYANIFYSYKKDISESNFLDNPPTNRPDFDAGVKYAFLITSAFNGCYPRSCGCSPISTNNKPKITSLVNKLKKQEYQDKLEKITNIHNDDFEKVINLYDSNDTFIYLDPPYFTPDENGKDTGKRASWYGTKDFNYETHMRLLNLLKNTKSKWALSYYYFKELEELLPKDKYTWVSQKFFRSSASFSETKSEPGEELLIMNYKLSDEELKSNLQFFNKTTKKVKIVEEKNIEKQTNEQNDEFWS
jgi:DNA adenine methylase